MYYQINKLKFAKMAAFYFISFFFLKMCSKLFVKIVEKYDIFFELLFPEHAFWK